MLRRKAKKDPVSPALREEVIRRDIAYAGGCVQAFLDETHACRNQYGDPQHPGRDLSLDHVQDSYGRMGRRAPSDPAHLVSLCWYSHILSGWATSHRPELREYLRLVQEYQTGEANRPNASEGIRSLIRRTSRSGGDTGHA